MDDPPETGQYEFLKSELTKRLGETDAKRVKKLIESEQLGDRSLYTITEDFILTVWEGRLPVHVQYILDGVQDRKPETLYRIADRILDVRTNPGQIAAASTDLPTAVSNSYTQNVSSSNSTAAAISTLKE